MLLQIVGENPAAGMRSLAVRDRRGVHADRGWLLVLGGWLDG